MPTQQTVLLVGGTGRTGARALQGLVNGLFAPGSNHMANVAHFVCQLATDPRTWLDWKSRLPVKCTRDRSSDETGRDRGRSDSPTTDGQPLTPRTTEAQVGVARQNGETTRRHLGPSARGTPGR